MEPAIQIHDLSKTYRRRNAAPIQAVSQLNLSVPAGQLFGFLGPNGAGKTTTIKMLCGLIKPSSGRVEIRGRDVCRERRATMPDIGVVLEGARNVHWSLSAWDNLLYFGHLKGMWGRRLSTRAAQLLRELDLWERRVDLVRTFSRGMQQKVALACALITDPPIVLLDEPTLGLDVQAARAVKTLVERLIQEQGKTVVLTTHQLDIAEALCHRIAIINKGVLIADKPVAELLALFRDEYYHIKLQGTLSPEYAAHFEEMTITANEDVTTLSGPVSDQDALYALLERVRAAGLPLLAVNRTEPDLEEVFIRLLDTGATREPEQ